LQVIAFTLERTSASTERVAAWTSPRFAQPQARFPDQVFKTAQPDRPH
jgi:hypothetical protein